MTLEIGLIIACCVIGLLGVCWALLAWRRHHGWGRVVQGVAVVIAALGLYFSGLLELLWHAAKGLWAWVTAVNLNNTISTGLALVGGAVILWVIGSFLLAKGYGRWSAEERRQRRVRRGAPDRADGVLEPPPAKAPASGTAPGARSVPAEGKAEPVDEDMAEIEAILKNRGIQ